MKIFLDSKYESTTVGIVVSPLYKRKCMSIIIELTTIIMEKKQKLAFNNKINSITASNIEYVYEKKNYTTPHPPPILYSYTFGMNFLNELHFFFHSLGRLTFIIKYQEKNTHKHTHNVVYVYTFV